MVWHSQPRTIFYYMLRPEIIASLSDFGNLTLLPRSSWRRAFAKTTSVTQPPATAGGETSLAIFVAQMLLSLFNEHRRGMPACNGYMSDDILLTCAKSNESSINHIKYELRAVGKSALVGNPNAISWIIYLISFGNAMRALAVIWTVIEQRFVALSKCK